MRRWTPKRLCGVELWAFRGSLHRPERTNAADEARETHNRQAVDARLPLESRRRSAEVRRPFGSNALAARRAAPCSELVLPGCRCVGPERETVACCFSPGDCAPHDNGRRIRPTPDATTIPRAGSASKDIRILRSEPSAPRQRSSSGSSRGAGRCRCRAIQSVSGIRDRTWRRDPGATSYIRGGQSSEPGAAQATAG